MRLFVYGTLMSGQPNHCLLSKAGKPQRAYIYGNLYDTGSRYPALEILGTQGDLGTNNYKFDLGLTKKVLLNEQVYSKVFGELYDIKDLSCFSMLDALEGYNPGQHSLFYRKLAPVMLSDGQVITSWVYEGNEQLFRAPIKTGDWRIHSNLLGER